MSIIGFINDRNVEWFVEQMLTFDVINGFRTSAVELQMNFIVFSRILFHCATSPGSSQYFIIYSLVDIICLTLVGRWVDCLMPYVK